MEHVENRVHFFILGKSFGVVVDAHEFLLQQPFHATHCGINTGMAFSGNEDRLETHESGLFQRRAIEAGMMHCQV